MSKEYTPDHPELNLCPECGSFFAPTAEHCPICGAFCPEEMRAGNRTAKHQKEPTAKQFWAQGRGAGRVRFVDWYHSWWFIVLMFFWMPIIGLVLLITSPHDKSKKILVGVIAAVYTVLSVYGGIGIGYLFAKIGQSFDKPVDTGMKRDAYIAACVENQADAEAFYRIPDSYYKKKTLLTVKITDRIDEYTENGEMVYYLCTDESGTYTYFVRDCTPYTKSTVNFLVGDTVDVYGEGAGNITVYVANADGSVYEPVTAPSIHMAYGEVKK